MPKFTPRFKFGYFDFNEEVSDASVEIGRWERLDAQLYGLFTIFGNGIISGLNVEEVPGDKLAIQVTEGRAHINFTSVSTTFPVNLELLPNTVNFVYAVYNQDTPATQNVDFITSGTRILDPYHLELAIVTVNESAVDTIDTSTRLDISFLEQIREEIRNHKHRGGTDHPSKINLETDVQGKLSSDNIADFPASKINRGTLSGSVLPFIDHMWLKNSGKLTHPQLDSFVKTLEVNNKELFGEIVTSNQLQRTIFLKLLFDDPTSPFYGNISELTDKYHCNEFVIIPGVSPDSFIDYDNTTAVVDKDNQEIRGKPPTQGSTFYVTYNKEAAWKTAYSLSNVSIVNDTVTLSKNPDDETSVKIVESFENVASDDQVISDGSLFRKEIVALSDEARMVSESSVNNVAEGAFSGKVSSYQTFRLKYIKSFTTTQDWSEYDSLLVDIKTNDIVHTQVKMYLTSDTGEESTHYLLLDSNEVTDNPENNGFVTRIVDLTTINFSNRISSLTIYLDDLSSQFVFYIDSITLHKAVLLPPEGTMLLRYSSPSPVTFTAADWDVSEPTGTSLRVRARSANGSVLLNRSLYSPYLSSGGALNLRGTDLEVEVTFYSDEERLLAPLMRQLRLIILSDTSADGFTIDSYEEFSLGTTINTAINESNGNITLKEPIYVGSHYFTSGNSIQQVADNISFSESQLAIFGSDTPIAPNLVFKRVMSNSKATVQSSTLMDPKSVVRLQNRNFLIADTAADRILEMNESGEFVKGFGSVNYQSSKLFPVAASYNNKTGILYIVWSKSLPFSIINVSRISLQTTTSNTPLRENFDLVYNLSKAELGTVNPEGQVTPIYLSLQNQSIVNNLDSLYVNVSVDVVSGGIDSDSIYYRAIKTGIGIPCFVGDFSYINGIHAPTYAGPTENDGYTIANAKIGVQEYTVPNGVTNETLTKNVLTSISSVIEIDSSGNPLWAAPDNWVDFSPFVPGRAEAVSDAMIIAGIFPQESENDVDVDFTAFSRNSSTFALQKQKLSELFEGRSGVAGVISNYKSSNWAFSYYYVSPEGVLISDADFEDGLYVAQTSFGNSGGKIMKLDVFGNVIFDFGDSIGLSLVNDINVKEDGRIVIST